MNSKRCAVLVAFAAIFSLSSCSGVGDTCKVNCGGGGGGTASLNVTLAAVPFVPPPSTSILSFAVTINSVTLIPANGGSAYTIPLNATTYSVDLTHLQSDSVFLGQSITVPAGTYNQVKVGVSSAIVTYCVATSGIPGCNANSIAQFNAGPSTPVTPTSAFTLASNQQAGIQVRINLGNAMTVNAVTQAVTAADLTAANVFTAVALPPTASTLAQNQLDYIEDITGTVSAVAPNSVTVQTATLGSITSVITGSTLVSQSCVVLNQACTATVGQVVSMDATLNSDGSSSMLYFDPLTFSSVDLIEGIVTSETASNTQFQIVANNFVNASSNSLISGLNLGDTVNVTLANLTAGFFVDSKGLTVNGTFFGSTSATDIHTGQTVMIHVTAFTAKSGNTPAKATADGVVLRFTRFAAAASQAGNIQFSITSLPPFYGFTAQPQVLLSTGSPITYLDGYSSIGSINSGDTLGIRALYFGTGVTPQFSAAKIRNN